MSSKLNIRTGDTVMVITGDEMKDRGKTGKVLKVYPEAQRVVVQGRKTFQTLCSFAPTAKSPLA